VGFTSKCWLKSRSPRARRPGEPTQLPQAGTPSSTASALRSLRSLGPSGTASFDTAVAQDRDVVWQLPRQSGFAGAEAVADAKR